MNPAISIIVPVYKAEKYLSKCIESLMAQTFTDIEIILVDDGSPDGSGTMCDAYAEKDPRIKVIHQSNRGAATARNTALDGAYGEFVMFVDSDDWVEPEYCRIPYEKAIEQDADCVMFKYVWVEEGKPPKQQPDHQDGLRTNKEAFYLIDQGVGVGPTNKIFKRTLFNDIRFPDGRRFEDIVAVPKLIHSCRKIYYINIPLYYYRANAESGSHSYSHKANNDMFEMSMERIHLLEEWHYDDIAEGSWFWPCWAYLVREGRHSEHSSESLRYVLGRPEGMSDLPTNKKLMYVLLKSLPPLFDLMCIIMGRRSKGL